MKPIPLLGLMTSLVFGGEIQADTWHVKLDVSPVYKVLEAGKKQTTRVRIGLEGFELNGGPDMTADCRLPARCLLVLALLLDGEAHAIEAEDSVSNVRIEEGRVDITLTAPEKQYALPAKIRVSLSLRNVTDQRDTVRRVFPIAAPPRMRVSQSKTPWCRVMVNDVSVDFETKLIVDRTEQPQVSPSGEQAIAWSKRLEEWFAVDEQLMTLIERYRRLASVQAEMSEMTATFRERVKRYLIHKDLDYAALEVANGEPYFGHLVKLMPEIEAAYRIDGKFQRWEYVSLLSDVDPEVYRPYEKEWREKADKWFTSKPDLVKLVPKLRELTGSFRESQQLLAGRIFKHLHDVNGLSLPVAVQVQAFIVQGERTPSTDLLRMMFPDIDAQLKKQLTALSMRLRDRGFDESVVSPFTGKLMPYSSMPVSFARSLENDDTVLAELRRPKENTPFVQRGREALITPMLILFEAPLEPKSASTIVIEYDTALLPLQNPMASNVMFGTVEEEVMAVFPSPHEVPFSVTCPAGFQPIIAPGPRAVASIEDGARRFDGQLNGEQSALHVKVVNFAIGPFSWTSPIGASGIRIAKEVQLLVERIENPTVRPLLMTSQYDTLLRSGDLWNAHQLALQIRIDHPDFGGLLDSLPDHFHRAVDAKQLYEWVTQKAISPHIETEEDLKRFEGRSRNDGKELTPAALNVLADRVGRLKEDSLTLQEKMGRLFILCQAGVDTEENLGSLLKLADANPLEAQSSLKLIQFLTVELKSPRPCRSSSGRSMWIFVRRPESAR